MSMGPAFAGAGGASAVHSAMASKPFGMTKFAAGSRSGNARVKAASIAGVFSTRAALRPITRRSRRRAIHCAKALRRQRGHWCALHGSR